MTDLPPGAANWLRYAIHPVWERSMAPEAFPALDALRQAGLVRLFYGPLVGPARSSTFGRRVGYIITNAGHAYLRLAKEDK